MIDLRTVCASNVVIAQRRANPQREIGEVIDVSQFQRLIVITNQKEPIATPRDVAGHFADAFHLNRNVLGEAIAGYVLQRDRVRAVVLDGNAPHRSLKHVTARLDPAEMAEGDGDTDRAMAA